MSLQSQENSPFLTIPEWSVVVLVTGFFLFLLLAAKIEENFSPIPYFSDETYEQTENIKIVIDGAVCFPGSYFVKKGSDVKEILKKARPSLSSDLKESFFLKKIEKNQKWMIPKKKVLTVFLLQEDRPLSVFFVLPKTPLCHLLRLNFFDETKDLTKLQKNRFLRDKEMIVISKKRSLK